MLAAYFYFYACMHDRKSRPIALKTSSIQYSFGENSFVALAQ